MRGVREVSRFDVFVERFRGRRQVGMRGVKQEVVVGVQDEIVAGRQAGGRRGEEKQKKQRR